MPRLKKIAIIISLLLFPFFLKIVPLTFAQSQTDTSTGIEKSGIGVARMIEVKDKNVKDGNILTYSSQGAVPSDTPYDPQVLGVVSRNAGIILNTQGDGNAVPVISDGIVFVIVSSQQGNIKRGDQITTSTIPGVGVLAVKSGYVLGSALEDYSNSDAKKTGTIAVSLNLHYFNSKPTFAGTLSDIFKLALLPTKDSPSPIFKYVVAALVVLGSLVLGFMTFGRTAAKGVEALGRNPAASGVIHLGIIFNVAIVVIIIGAGLTIGFLILRL